MFSEDEKHDVLSSTGLLHVMAFRFHVSELLLDSLAGRNLYQPLLKITPLLNVVYDVCTSLLSALG